MPGVYLIVSNFGNLEQQAVLRNTSGGYPHVTIMHANGFVEKAKLLRIGTEALDECLGRKLPLLPDRVKINSFFHERSGCQRYDVLMYLDEKDSHAMGGLRDSTMSGEPHVTHSIHWSKEDARDALRDVQRQLPITVEITGFVLGWKNS